MSEWKLGDVVKIERAAVIRSHTAEDNDRLLGYALNNKLPPECVVKYDFVTLTTQRMVDEHNARGAHEPR